MTEKIYTFKISFDKKTFRVIEIRGEKTLYDFADTILSSFDFAMDHAFGFFGDLQDLCS